MKILILSIGKWKGSLEESLYRKYSERLPRNRVDLMEIDGSWTKEQEGLLLLKPVKPDDFVVALDEKGKDLSTQEIKGILTERVQDPAKKRIVFIIGGADGLSNQVKERSNLLISFGRVTWPHLLVRVLLIEQIYRIMQIQKGHPYHRA